MIHLCFSQGKPFLNVPAYKPPPCIQYSTVGQKAKDHVSDLLPAGVCLGNLDQILLKQLVKSFHFCNRDMELNSHLTVHHSLGVPLNPIRIQDTQTDSELSIALRQKIIHSFFHLLHNRAGYFRAYTSFLSNTVSHLSLFIGFILIAHMSCLTVTVG